MRIPALLALSLTFPACAGTDRSNCEPVSPELSSHILQGLTIEGSGELRNAQAVRHDSTWVFVSAELDGPGLEGDGQLGTWVVSASLPGSGVVYAADEATEGVSRWGAIRTTQLAGIENAPAAAASRQCVRSAG